MNAVKSKPKTGIYLILSLTMLLSGCAITTGPTATQIDFCSLDRWLDPSEQDVEGMTTAFKARLLDHERTYACHCLTPPPVDCPISR